MHIIPYLALVALFILALAGMLLSVWPQERLTVRTILTFLAFAVMVSVDSLLIIQGLPL